jgi:hypothetical protein
MTYNDEIEAEWKWEKGIAREFAMRLLAQNIANYMKGEPCSSLGEAIGAKFHRHLQQNLNAHKNASRAAKVAPKFGADPQIVYAIIFEQHRCQYGGAEVYPILLEDISWVVLERPE